MIGIVSKVPLSPLTFGRATVTGGVPVAVALAVAVVVAVAVTTDVGVFDGVFTTVAVAVGVFVAVAVDVGVLVGVGVGGVAGMPAAISRIVRPTPIVPCEVAVPFVRLRKNSVLPVATKAFPGEVAAVPAALKMSKPITFEPVTPVNPATLNSVPVLGEVPLPGKKSIDPWFTRALFVPSIS